MKQKILVIGNRHGRHLASRLSKQSKYYNFKFVVMSFVLSVHRVIGVINYPTKGGKVKVLEVVNNIKTKCTGNADVTISAADIATVGDAITAYKDSVGHDTPGAKNTMTLTITDLLLAPFQAKANSDHDHAREILEGGGFHCKEQAIHQIQEFKVKDGDVSGTVAIQTAGGPKNKTNHFNWYESTDGITFHWKKSTTKSKTTLSGYTPGTKIWFVSELLINDVSQGMSQAIYIFIK